MDCTLLTEWQVSFSFFQPGSPAAALPGATFRFALKETPTGDPLIFNSSLTASGAVYTADISSVDSAALRTLIGDQPSIEVVGEIEWTISSRRERVHFPVTVTNAWARPDDAAPDPVAEASIVWFNEQLATRAVRFDVAQTLTTQQKTQGRDNLGITGTGGSAAWADITGKPSTFPPSAHTHAIADVTGLQTALDAKAASSHTQAISTITGLQTALDGKANILTGVAEQVQILFTNGDAANLILGKYITLCDASGTVGVWWSNTSNSQPSEGPTRWISVGVTDEDDADLVTAKTASTLAADSAFTAVSSSGSLLFYTLATVGEVNDAAAGNTAFTVQILTQGVNVTPLPAANLTGTIANARLPSTITGLTSVTSSAFVGPLTGVASGNLVAGGALGTPSSGNLANCTSIPAGQLTGSVATARLGTGTADATTYLRGDATWATVSGGLSNITETLLTASPNNTVNAERLAVTNGTTNVDLVLTPKGTGAFILHGAPDGSTNGNKRGQYAVDLGNPTGSAPRVASGDYSSVIGGFQVGASGTYAVAGGNSSIAEGSHAIAIGSACQATVSGAIALGTRNEATAINSAVVGGDHGKSRIYGSRVLGHQNSTNWPAGSGQAVDYVCGISTTNNTPTELVLSYFGTSATVTSGSVYGFIVNVVGVKAGGSAVAYYTRRGMIKNVSGTTSLVGSIQTIGTDIEDSAGTDITITADDTNDRLKIEATGIASEVWRWTAQVSLVEVVMGNY